MEENDMGNNMDLGYEMFCYQCEQTANGKGCTKLGVCGKTPEIANLQDLLIYQVKGISCYGKLLIDQGQHVDKQIVSFIENVLFTTLTNVNFDPEVHVNLLKQSQKIKDDLRNQVGEPANPTAVSYTHLPAWLPWQAKVNTVFSAILGIKYFSRAFLSLPSRYSL